MTIQTLVHPVVDGQYVIPTHATELASTFVVSAVRRRLPGCILVGKQRSGKTRAIRQIEEDLRHELSSDIVVVVIEAPFCYKDPSENKHYRYCLTSIKHLLSDVGDGRDKASRFQDAIIQKVAASGQRRVVIIYDEANNLWEEHYGYLINDYNRFDKLGIKATYVLVGQEELLLNRKSYILAERHQIVGRFMVRPFTLRGIQGAAEIRTCCESYDERTEFPAGSGISYTQHFFPAAFRNGWRLAGMADRIHARYENLRSRHSIPRDREIGMQYFAPVIEQLLTELGNQDILQPEISDQWIDEAIIECGYISAAIADLGKAV